MRTGWHPGGSRRYDRSMRTPAILLTLLIASGSAPAVSIDPGTPGPFLVAAATRTFVDAARGRTLVTEVWYPALDATREAAARHGRFPLVLMAHGNCGFRTNYEYLTTFLASHGFVVAAPDFPGFNKSVCDAGGPETGLLAEPPVDLVFLHGALRDPAGPAGLLAMHVRGRHAGLVGHSLGGLAVVNAAVASADFRAVVGLAPAAAAPQASTLAGLRPRRAVIALAGTADTTVPLAAFTLPFFQALAPPAFLVTITGGTHSGFTDEDSHLSPAALERQQALVRRYATAFLLRYLRGQRRAGAVLTAADAAAQGADVMLDTRP